MPRNPILGCGLQSAGQGPPASQPLYKTLCEQQSGAGWRKSPRPPGQPPSGHYSNVLARYGTVPGTGAVLPGLVSVTEMVGSGGRYGHTMPHRGMDHTTTTHCVAGQTPILVPRSRHSGAATTSQASFPLTHAITLNSLLTA